MAVPTIDAKGKHNGTIMTWNALKECLPAVGYTVE